MAITKAFPRIKADILIDSAALQEYDDDEEPSSDVVMTKYIEATSGAEFAIRCQFHARPQYDILTRVLLDGKYVMGSYALLKNFHNGYLELSLYGVRSNKNNEWTLAKFCFSDLKTVDGTNKPGDQLMKDLKGIGQITVDFHYITNVRTSARPLPLSDKVTLKDVPEKALKGRALSQQTALRAPTPTNSCDIMESDYVDRSGKSFASINFKYRSREALQSLLIIPRSPSPVLLEERDVDTLSPAEMRELLRRQREREEAARATKCEGALKRERSRERSRTVNNLVDDDELSFISAKRRKLPVTLNEDGVETIDLTC
ncbi:hypothetical protein EK21DRAFT_77178 [Setomelanomma holmii]|uniref:DUF7918 domain-containing protein n=1 Tax=Setomelanomma holmii TaxID=210430 RepID=A0A9P4GZQ5_9PLEO|nr:hypothetical protein EK21DRAFT_77178 [Setomelanomma holmii]